MNIAEAARKAASATQEVKKALTSAYQKTLLDIGDSLVFFTPLDTGLSSSNWNIGSTGHIPSQRKVLSGVKGRAAKEAMKDQVLKVSLGGVVLFNNPVDYIDDLERGVGSPQAPSGMIRPTKIRIEGMWLDNLNKLKLIT